MTKMVHFFIDSSYNQTCRSVERGAQLSDVRNVNRFDANAKITITN